jgi:predicted unusual protein kinase regulating ubiquinone biosynthesis (AarF/ABC1/UbiB family)
LWRGTLFVKLGQNLANRPDLVEESLMEELTALQVRLYLSN